VNELADLQSTEMVQRAPQRKILNDTSSTLCVYIRAFQECQENVLHSLATRKIEHQVICNCVRENVLAKLDYRSFVGDSENSRRYRGLVERAQQLLKEIDEAERRASSVEQGHVHMPEETNLFEDVTSPLPMTILEQEQLNSIDTTQAEEPAASQVSQQASFQTIPMLERILDALHEIDQLLSSDSPPPLRRIKQAARTCTEVRWAAGLIDQLVGTANHEPEFRRADGPPKAVSILRELDTLLRTLRPKCQRHQGIAKPLREAAPFFRNIHIQCRELQRSTDTKMMGARDVIRPGYSTV